VWDVIQKDHRLCVRAVAEMVNLDGKSVWRILTDELNVKKVCAKRVPKMPSVEQKELWKEICPDLLQHTKNKPDLLKSVITCDETWIFMYNPETKWQAVHWKSPNSPRTKKGHVLFKVQGHADSFPRYPGCCIGRVVSQWPDCHSTLLYWSLD
jgi:hypothetical protein